MIATQRIVKTEKSDFTFLLTLYFYDLNHSFTSELYMKEKIASTNVKLKFQDVHLADLFTYEFFPQRSTSDKECIVIGIAADPLLYSFSVFFF